MKQSFLSLTTLLATDPQRRPAAQISLQCESIFVYFLNRLFKISCAFLELFMMKFVLLNNLHIFQSTGKCGIVMVKFGIPHKISCKSSHTFLKRTCTGYCQFNYRQTIPRWRTMCQVNTSSDDKHDCLNSIVPGMEAFPLEQFISVIVTVNLISRYYRNNRAVNAEKCTKKIHLR